MASLMRASFSRAAAGRLFSLSKTAIRAASNVHPNPPPITPVSGPDWKDSGWKDDGFGLGDYPNLPERSAQLRDPYKTYWDQQDRRNFGEPLQEDDDVLNVWMPDLKEQIYTPYEILGQFITAFSLLGLLLWYSEYVYVAQNRDPAAPKEYPNLYLELGGNPENADTAEAPTRIPTPIYF